MADSIVSVELNAKIAKFVSGMRTASGAADKAAKAIDKSVNAVSSAVTSKFAGIFSTAAIVGFGKAVLDVTAEFQKFNAVLSTTFGSSALANAKLQELQEFAAKTPYGISELTAAFVKLANSGFKPTADQMTKLGDLASSTGKSFDQLAEAIIDAQTGEFERLKEFGIRAKDAGDSVVFTYRGVQTQVEKTSTAIREYITNLGGAEGVSGSMAKISQTLGGQISNLGDNWDKMLLSVGNNTSGIFNSAIATMSKAIEKITQYNEELEIASNYDLGSKTGDFLQQLNRAVNPFASKGATSIERSTFNIKQARKDVTEFIATTTAGAKSTADFGRALASLKEKGDRALKDLSIQSEEERRGIRDAYQEGVRAIQDARRNFSGESGGAANFGTAKKGVKDTADVLKDLAKDLKIVEFQFGATFSDKTQTKIAAYQKAIDDLVKMGVDPASKSVQNLIDTQRSLFQLPQKAIGSVLEAGKDNLPQQELPAGLRFKPMKIFKEQANILAAQKKFNEDFSALVTTGVGDSIGNFAESIGEAFASGGNVIESIGGSILGTFGGFLSQFGKLLVEYGAAALFKAKLDASLAVPGAGLITGPLAIAAGIALQVAAGAFSRLASNVGGKRSSAGPTAFANGGVVYTPTNALIGEYPGARNNPEVVAPLDKLKSLIGGGGNDQIVVYNTIDDKGIATIVNRGNKKLGRI